MRWSDGLRWALDWKATRTEDAESVKALVERLGKIN
jgi:hypothetical protein